VVRIRRATEGDADVLARLLVLAADWRPDAAPRPVDEVLGDPTLARYVQGWPRPGDLGVIAERDDGAVLGAAWCRRFTADDAGFGFVSPTIPELSIAVVPGSRGAGIGRSLLDRLIGEARQGHVSHLSLSVERDNPARRLYTALGFAEVASPGGSLTMVRSLTDA